MNKRPVIRSIDLGYGNTKFSYLNPQSQKIVFDSFPSLAVRSSDSSDLITSGMGKYNLKSVVTDSGEFKVGKDIECCDHAGDFGGTSENYIQTPGYHALFKGALSYIGEPHIDYLTVGLPVHRYMRHRDELAELCTGEHHLGDGTTVLVKNVKVVIQPYGGLCANLKENESINTHLNDTLNERHLIVDVGHHTTDWIVARGLNLIGKACNSYPTGMYDVLKKLSALTTQDDYEVILHGLKNGNRMMLNRELIDISPHIPASLLTLDKAMSSLKNSIDGMQDKILQVHLVGGGALFIKGCIETYFKDSDITVLDNPTFANVRGFQAHGEQAWIALHEGEAA